MARLSEAPYWSVTVSIDGEPVLTIGRDEMAGIPNIDDYADQVRECALHLLAFIGEEHSAPAARAALSQQAGSEEE